MIKKNNNENFLDKKPSRKPEIVWSTDEKGIVTLEIQNKGIFNFLAQKLFKKPKISYIHLDEMGSFIWPIIDGEKDITHIGKIVDEHPLYERLAKFFSILQSYGFITLS